MDQLLVGKRDFFGCEEYEHNNECRAIEVIGQDWSSEVVALSRGLGAWRREGVALSCHMTMDLPCQEKRDSFSLFTVFAVSQRSSCGGERGPESQLSEQTKAFLSPVTGCDNEGEGCGERK